MIEIWGHRGARGLFPENTVQGIRAALALGIAGVEIDVALTADAIAVLSHDPELPTDDGVTLISRLRADEVARLPGGTTIPRLDAVLAIGGRCLIELKTYPDRPTDTASPATMAETVAAAVDRARAGARVRIESFDWRGPRHLRRTRPDLPLAWLTRAETERDARLWWDGPTPADFGGSVPRAVAAEGSGGTGGTTWAPEHVTLTRARVEEARALGLRVLAWTVNEAADIRRMMSWGVDGVITDRPDIALAMVTRGPAR
ncbi:MAG: glycerophosphodiester phosphodiesterase family protein [Acetobacteraceae bacterium]